MDLLNHQACCCVARCIVWHYSKQLSVLIINQHVTLLTADWNLMTLTFKWVSLIIAT